MSVTIKSIGGRELFVAESAADVRAAVVEAVKRGAYLGGVDLRGADLGGAYLRSAYLGGAYLRGACLGGADLRSAYLGGVYLRGADLGSADLGSADLRGADLGSADLRSADLRGADLRGADLRGADLGSADLRGADLRGADLGSADLRSADLRSADLGSADLRGADLRGANNAEYALAQTIICPEGNLIGWKKCQGGRLVKLGIPADAKRSNGFGRKCRAEYARVLEILHGDTNVDEARSQRDSEFIYRVGETVRPDSLDEDRWNQCAPGIHFYITRAEAEAHV